VAPLQATANCWDRKTLQVQAEEKARKEEEERVQREKEEKERADKEQAEQDRLAREAEEKRLSEEAEKKVAEQASTDKRADEVEEGEIFEDQDTPLHSQDGRDKVRETLRINTTTPAIGRLQHPGPLDLEEAKKSNITGPQSALATARIISDILSAPYPEVVSSPNPALNQNAKEGKFWCVTVALQTNLFLTYSFTDTTENSCSNSCHRYDCEFLLQFMSICKEKPATLLPLDAIGIEPLDLLHLMCSGSGRHHTSSTALPPTASVNWSWPFTRHYRQRSPEFLQSHGKLRNLTCELGNTTQKQAATSSMYNYQMGFDPVVPLQATANR